MTRSCRLPMQRWCGLLLLLVFAWPIGVSAQSPSLFGQSANALLQTQFGSADLSWLLLDRNGTVLAQRWDAPDQAIPPGSLVKPFVVAAYAAQHNNSFPRVRCAGTRSLCWLPHGHGELGMEEALAQSCNAYFLALAAGLDQERARETFRSFGLAGPGANLRTPGMIGLGAEWRETPLAIAHAYLALLNASDAAVRARVLAGMRGAADHGTAAAVEAALGPEAALAKTGTAPCTHHPQGQADGFAVLLVPAVEPRYLLMVRMHDATGARAAAEGAEMLRAIGLGRP